MDGGNGEQVEEGESGFVTPPSTLVDSFYSEAPESAKKWHITTLSSLRVGTPGSPSHVST